MAFVVYPTAKIIVDALQCTDACKQHMIKCPFKHGENGDIGDFTFIRAKKLTLGEGVHIAPRVTIVGTGSVEIGDYSTIAPGVVIYTSVPDLRFGTNKYAEKFELKEGDVKIGKNVFIGAQAVIAQGVTIGDNAVIGAGTYIDEDVPANKIYRNDVRIFWDERINDKRHDYMETIEKFIPEREMEWRL